MKKIRNLILLLVIVLAVCGCSSESTQVKATGTEVQTDRGSSGEQLESMMYPVTVSHGAGDLIVENKPSRILSLSPAATEILFAIGAGHQVYAVDDQSNYPPEAPTTGISGYAPNLEAILGMEPDLVVHSYLPEDLETSLANVGIPSMAQFAASSLADTYEQIEMLGIATDNQQAAEGLISSMKLEIQILVDKAEILGGGTFYHELDQTYYSVTSSTFIGEIYTLLGLENIADDADPDGSGYPQLTEEYILAQNPDFIFLADIKCCGQTSATVNSRPGWGALSAVQENVVIELDDDIASRWGPRVVNFISEIVNAMEQRAS